MEGRGLDVWRGGSDPRSGTQTTAGEQKEERSQNNRITAEEEEDGEDEDEDEQQNNKTDQNRTDKLPARLCVLLSRSAGLSQTACGGQRGQIRLDQIRSSQIWFVYSSGIAISRYPPHSSTPPLQPPPYIHSILPPPDMPVKASAPRAPRASRVPSKRARPAPSASPPPPPRSPSPVPAYNTLQTAIAGVFAAAQKTTAGHRKLVINLRSTFEQCLNGTGVVGTTIPSGKYKGEKAFVNEFCRFLSRVLVVKKSEVVGDRCLRFADLFVRGILDKGETSPTFCVISPGKSNCADVALQISPRKNPRKRPRPRAQNCRKKKRRRRKRMKMRVRWRRHLCLDRRIV